MGFGILANTKNDDTDYETGSEFHLDFVANQFLTETFAIGVRGYYYNQFTGDRGSGARLGGFEGESVGLGPGFVWFPKFADGKLTVLGKWIHDFKATKRFESEFGTLTDRLAGTATLGRESKHTGTGRNAWDAPTPDRRPCFAARERTECERRLGQSDGQMIAIGFHE